MGTTSRFGSAVPAWAGALLVASTTFAEPPLYVFEERDGFGPDDAVYTVLDVNDRREAVGSVHSSALVGGAYWDADGAYDFLQLGFDAIAINDLGHWLCVDRWFDGTTTRLLPAGFVAVTINNKDVVLGTQDAIPALHWPDGTVVTIPELAEACDLDDDNTVVGSIDVEGPRAAYWTPTDGVRLVRDLAANAPPDFRFETATDISSAFHIVGLGRYEGDPTNTGYLVHDGTFTLLPLLPGETRFVPVGVSADGRVLGESVSLDYTVLVAEGQAHALTDLFFKAYMDPSLARGLAISDAGHVGGATFHPNPPEDIGFVARAVRGRIIVEPTTITVPELHTASVMIRLEYPPGDDVVVTVERTTNSNDDDIAIVGPSEFTFDPSNWDQPQELVFTAARDVSDDANMHRFLAECPEYAPELITALEGEPKFVFSVTGRIDVPEGDTVTVDVTLNQDPKAEIDVTFEIDGDLDFSVVEPDVLHFDSDSWFEPRTIVIAAAEDDDNENGLGAVWLRAPIVNDGAVILRELDNDSDCPEDLNGDGVVELSDLGILLASYDIDDGGDIDGDGDTDLSDLGRLLGSWGLTCD